MNNLDKSRQVIYDKYPEYIASDRLREISLDTKGFKVVYTIRVRLIKYSRCVKGEKITNRFGRKLPHLSVMINCKVREYGEEKILMPCTLV